MKATKAQLESDLNSGEPVLLFDIREEYEVMLNPLPYSETKHMPMATYQTMLEEMKQAKTYMVCKSGERAENLSYYISKTYGIDNIYFVEGGAQEILGVEI